MSKINLIHADCMAYLRSQKDNAFELAIVDPPYGIGISGGKVGGNGKEYEHFEGNDASAPDEEYFQELRRVSKNQIIWGANHFCNIFGGSSPCWIVWDKEKQGLTFADCELAYTSFKSPVKLFKFRWNGFMQGNMKNKEVRIHPTQKPVALYEWLLVHYAKTGDRILDTHLGSASSAIAAWNLHYDFTGIELSEHYFKEAVERVEKHKLQQRMEFDLSVDNKNTDQLDIF